LERVHQTLKKYDENIVFRQSKRWDDGICMLLFVVREAFQESLSLLLLMLLVYFIMWSILGISLQEHVK
jgi:hypothetical protein